MLSPTTRTSTLLTAMLLALAAAGCDRVRKCTEPGCDASERPVQSRYYANENSDTVIVFFHGIFGDPLTTWSAGDTANSFPT